jgi:hypothetical protein
VIRLKTDELKPGMILARSVFNQQDLLLLEKNNSLTEKHIWMLKTWGIDQVSVQGKPKDDSSTVFEAELETKETVETGLRAKFADVLDDPVMEVIMKAASRLLQKNLSDPEKENEST